MEVKMRKIELDLNKLTDEELEMYLTLKKKAGLPEEVKIIPPLAYPEEEQIVDEKPRFVTVKKRKKRKASKKWVQRAKNLEKFLQKPRTRADCLIELGVMTGGFHETLVKYLKKVYGKRLKIIEQGRTRFFMIDTVLTVKKPVEEPVEEKLELVIEPKKKETEYMIRKNPYLTYRNKYLKRVMGVHNMNVQDATRYLSSKWMAHGRSQEKVSPKVEFELAAEMIEEALPRKISPELKFPKIATIKTKHGEKILIDMIKNIVKEKGLTLAFNSEAGHLGIEHYWQWVDFCKEFLKKSRKIADALGIENKFVLCGYGKNGMGISYMGGDR